MNNKEKATFLDTLWVFVHKKLTFLDQVFYSILFFFNLFYQCNKNNHHLKRAQKKNNMLNYKKKYMSHKLQKLFDFNIIINAVKTITTWGLKRPSFKHQGWSSIFRFLKHDQRPRIKPLTFLCRADTPHIRCKV